MTIKAINKKHQRAVTKAYSLYRKYHELVNLEDTVEPYTGAADRLANKQEKAYDKYLDVFEELPQREQASFVKQHTTLHGYS